MTIDPFEIVSAGDDAGADSWLVTYADAITLLMAFFVVMFSISKPDSEKLDQVSGGLSQALHKKETAASPFQLLAKEAELQIDQDDEEKSTDISSSARGMTFDFKSGKVFGAGSAEILPEAEATLDRVAQLITFMGVSNYKVEVEGHTDDVPINTARFPSNWELSSSRASAVVRFLVSRGVEPKRMGAIGYADTRPKKPHRDKEGNPIIENRGENRRVVIRIQR